MMLMSAQTVQVDETKIAIVREARLMVSSRWPGTNMDAACLQLAWAVAVAARRRGVRLLVQGGSAFWKAVSDVCDDGVSANRFGYGWEPYSGKTMESIAMGLMPELHVWAIDPERKEIVDLTTGAWPRQALSLANMVWSEEQPPDFLWASYEDLPVGCEYLADEDACALVQLMLERELGL